MKRHNQVRIIALTLPQINNYGLVEEQPTLSASSPQRKVQEILRLSVLPKPRFLSTSLYTQGVKVPSPLLRKRSALTLRSG